MKNKFLYVFFIGIAGFLTSCDIDNPNEDKFDANPSSGWVSFNTTSESVGLAPVDTMFSIPVIINAPVNNQATTVNYEIQTVEGADPSTFISTGSSIVIPAGEREGEIVLTIDNEAMQSLSEYSAFEVVLTSTDNSDLMVGLGDGSSITSYLVSTPCPINPSLSYTGQSEGLGADFPPHDVQLQQVGPNQYYAESLWGPEAVAVLTGDPSYSGQFLYSAILTIDPDDYSVTISAAPDSTAEVTGGTGQYDACSDTFNLTLEQGLFSNPFTINVTLE